MKDYYTIRPGLRAIASTMAMPPLGVAITSIEVREERGRGHARALLKQITDDADREGIRLVLSVAPDGTGLDDRALRRWYERAGFVEQDGGYMSRDPAMTPSLLLYVCPTCGYAMRETEFPGPVMHDHDDGTTVTLRVVPDDGRDADPPGVWYA